MKRKITLIVTAAILVLAMGVTTALAASASDRTPLTEEQKAELTLRMEQRLEQDLADGKITQEQYDTMLEASANGERFSFGRARRGGFGEMTEEQKATMEEFRRNRSELTDEQKAALPFGGKFNREDMPEDWKAAMEERMANLPDLTDEQKESMRERFESRGDRSDMRGNGRVPMHEGRGMRGKGFSGQ